MLKNSLLLLCLLPLPAAAHTLQNSAGKQVFTEELRQHLAEEFMAKRQTAANTQSVVSKPKPIRLQRPLQVASTGSAFNLAALLSLSSYLAPTGNGALMAAAFGSFKPRVRFFWDGTTFYEESDNMPDNSMMPNLMVGITSWQQQVPLPAAYFASVTNPEGTAGSLGFGQPNYWRLPLVPVPAASPLTIFTVGSTTNNFQRGAIALASNGIAIFNPANNTGRVSYEIGELDAYGGHCGLADDYHYHIIPMHLSARFGGPLTDDKPVAWALDGYPIYGYVEPDGTARQTLDSHGGHDHGGWNYHYHAIGSNTVDATHPFGTPASPYTMTTFHGTVVNFGGQVDGQPEVGSLRQSGTGGYTAQPVSGASITAFKNPVALATDGSGHLVENVGGTPSQDSYLMRVSISGTTYDECWKINRNATPRTLTITWRLSGATTTTTYTPGNATAIARLATYGMADPSQLKIPDTSQVTDTTTTFGEDADYTLNAQSFTDNSNGTITDNITGLMWQKTDNGESTWDNAVVNAASVTTGGYTDWRLPTPGELFSLFNHNNGNPVALNTTYFPSASPAAEYWWSSDVYGTGANSTSVWCANSGGGLGGKPKSETVSAGGALQYHARYVRGTKPTNGHNYRNNGDGTITDLDTNLMWTQVPGPAAVWEAALTYAEGLALGGFTDWRLPNIKELQTLTDYTLTTATATTNIKPSINRSAFGKVLTNCATTSGSGLITCADTTGLVVGMPVVDPSSIAATYISSTTVPTVTVVNSTTSFTISASASAAGAGLVLKALPLPVAYWSATSLKSDTTKAWLVETGINTAVPAANGPTRNSQGIISYESKTLASYPVFAVRSVSAGSISQGRATTTTTNLFQAGQRVSAVGTITATDNSMWTVPAATLFATAPKAADLYNEYNAVTPANIASAQTAISNLPTQVIDSDGEVVTGYIFSDNYFELYVNGVLVGVDPVPYTSFNSCVVKFKAKRPITYAVRLVDWEENLGLGTELNSGDPYHIGDGGFMANFSDGTVTNNQWKAQTFNIAPLDNPAQVVDLANGTHDSTAATTHSLTETAYALHYPLPADWFSKTFANTGWPAATTYTEAQVGINSIPAYSNFPAQFGSSGAQFIWSSNLLLDNEVIVRYTGPAAAATQIAVEQPSGTALTDGTSTVAYGSVNVGSTLSKTFVIRNNSTTTALSITGVTIDGTNAANFTVTTSPATSIAAGGSTTMIVQFAPTAAGAKSAAVHLASSDTAVGSAFDISLTGTGVVPAPAITNIVTTPTVPSTTDTPTISATISPASGATITSATMTYSTGAQTTTTVFNEPMATTATSTGGWDGTGATNLWTPTSLDGAGNIKQTATTSNHTTGITGSCGVVLGKGLASSTDPTRTMITLTNPINATGTFTSGSTTTNYIEFWVRSAGLTGTNGWSFQLAPNGTTFTERVSEFTASIHGFQLYHYDLLATDLTSTLKMRIGFVGNGVGGPTGSSVNVDDIVVVTTSGSAPVPVTLTGAASGGTFSATIPAQAAGTTITYSIGATDSNGQTTTITNAGSYTTGPAPSITTNATLLAGTVGGAYSQTLAASGGSGAGYAWSVNAGSALPTGLTLTNGGLLSGTLTTAGTYNFTLRVTDSAGRIATRTFSLSVATTTLPNVVIILTDDQGWADVGYHTPSGQVPIQTPNMDRFGTDGIRLEKFYPTTICAVTRGCLLTGRNSLRTNVGNQKGLGLPEHTLPQTFKAAGYQTFMCGKWHIGGWDNNIYTTTMNGATIEVQHEGSEYHPLSRGWDFHKGQYGGAINYFTHTTSDPGKVSQVDWWQNGVQLLNDNTDLQGNGGYSTDLLADQAVAMINTRDIAKPMLLYLAFNAIHAGVSAPPSYLTKYQNLGVTNTNRRTICAAVDCMDVALGRVLAALDSAGITNNTLVIYMSDNGGDTATGALNTPLRGTKSDSYEGGLHTPAGIRWPGHLAAGVTSNQYVWVGDMFPTICAAVGVTPQNTKPFDGVNLWPQLQSITSAAPDGAPRGVPLVTGDAGTPVALNTFSDPVTSATNQMFKLIRTKGPPVVNELFNLTIDPYETTDLLLGANAASYAAIVTSLTANITGIVTENYPPYIGPDGITQTVVAGSTTTLYAPFSSYKAPTVQWRKNNSNISTAAPFYQVTSGGASVNGVYMATLTLTNVTSADAASYDVVVTSTSGTATSAAGTLTVAAPALTLSPATGLASSGFPGGAFTPASTSYTVSNSGTAAMDWSASKTAGWVTLSATSGTLAAGASATVTVSINSGASSLASGSYNDTVTFTNTTNAVGNTTRSVNLTVSNAPSAPVLTTLAAYTGGVSNTITWPAVSGATSYTLQIASNAGFTSSVVSQTVTSLSGSFANLTSGTTYYYRVSAINGAGSSAPSNVVSSTQDAVVPVVAITAPTSGSSTATNTITVTGSSADALSGISGVKVNNVTATSSNSFATWSATVPLGFGTNAITATVTDGAGNQTTSAAVSVTLTAAQTYNPLIIPDTISGTTFNLALVQKTRQFRTGAATTTYAYNNALMWGPTLIMNKGDAVQMNVTNNLIDTTTVHWHGFHIPAIMDGGPHQTVPAGTTWSPSWTVKNDAATYWYHPHLHGTTMEQLVKGAGGFIIVRDPVEAALALPRTYGVDDFPLALTSRRFLTSNQFSYDHAVDNYGDYMLVNGTLAPQVSLPKQYVRLRILNAEVARGYNLGFSDNRTFWVIANDQGLLSAPVAVTRVKLMVGERVEILVNLTNDTLASSIELKAFNSGQVFGFPGQEGNPVTPSGNAGPVNGSLLNNTDFNVLHINIAAATASPITALPATLVPQTYWTAANVTNTRSITLTGGNGGAEFTFNNISYTPTLFNHTIPLNAIEKWSISNNSGAIFGHSFHIHDIKFNIIARSGGTQVSSTGLAATYESGWKDTLYVPKGETVDVIAKYDDFASNTNPFMFHCHFLQHEDGGMMGQFVVVNNAVEALALASFTRTGNNSLISLDFKTTPGTTYTLQYSADMSTWTDIGSVTSDGTTTNFTETDTTRLGQAKGFYRVKIPTIP